MLLDKISVINDALVATGNSTVTTDDGSSEWIASSNAFDRMLPIVLYRHNWGFQTTTANLPRLGASSYPGYADIYEKPFDCLHLENVWRTDLALFVPGVSSFGIGGMGASPPQLDYKIIGDQIHCVAPSGLTALYVIDPAKHSNVILDVSAGILETLRREIESLIYQGLNEDSDSAMMTKKLALAEISEARAKADSESPRRAAFRSRLTEIRRGSSGGGGLLVSTQSATTTTAATTTAATTTTTTTTTLGTLGTFSVATLPVNPAAYSTAIASDGRKIGEAVGYGTGVIVYYSVGVWRVISTDAPVLA